MMRLLFYCFIELVVSRTVECQQFAQSVFIVIFVGQFQNSVF